MARSRGEGLVHTSYRPISGCRGVKSAVSTSSHPARLSPSRSTSSEPAAPSHPAEANTCDMMRRMAYIICEPCIGTKDTACVDVCPVDCIHPRKDEPDFAIVDMLYIHPDECIDCGACVPACPVDAIYTLDETPQKWVGVIATNHDYYESNQRASYITAFED